ncbi:hypothetical protein P5673_002086 [Acropora cervicornis]|uniref:Uncharacterized protein n=1 Tax=Acropora cervicornis TaxID=6130 RepID=A0AAD9R569_ACRCE|nr:hypothetical protein P5673_002086 [Acropora cervicornis]
MRTLLMIDDQVQNLQYRITKQERSGKFELNGAMFRGEPPRQLHFVSVDYSSLASNQYTVQLVSLEVQGLPESKSYTIQMDVANGERVINKSVKGPAADVRSCLPQQNLFLFQEIR